MDSYELGKSLDLETRRKKQQALMVKMVERKVRSRAKQLYESRGQGQGQELQDWFQAESEVLENATIAPLYRRVKGGAGDSAASPSEAQPSSVDPSCA